MSKQKKNNPYKQLLREDPIGFVGNTPYDQYVDNRTTIPEDVAVYDERTPIQAQMDALLKRQALIDTSDLPIGSLMAARYAGLKGIQLLKGKALAKKASYAAERIRNANLSKAFGVGLVNTGLDVNELMGR